MTRLRFFLLGAVLAVTGSAFASAFIDNGTAKTVSHSNPLPSGIYPAWGTDVAVTCDASGSTESAQLAIGRYVVTCGAVAWGDQGATGVVATTSERRIPANFVYPVRVDNATTNGYLALICTASTTCIVSLDS